MIRVAAVRIAVEQVEAEIVGALLVHPQRGPAEDHLHGGGHALRPLGGGLVDAAEGHAEVVGGVQGAVELDRPHLAVEA